MPTAGDQLPEFRKGAPQLAEDMQALVKQIKSLSVQGNSAPSFSLAGTKFSGSGRDTDLDQDRCWIINKTGQAFTKPYYVVQIDSMVSNPNTVDVEPLEFPYFRGAEPECNTTTQFAVLQDAPANNGWSVAVASGCTWVRLTGEMGKKFASVRAGEYTMEASDAGPATILADPGPANEERIARVRIGIIPAEMVIFQLTDPNEVGESGPCDCGSGGWDASVTHTLCGGTAPDEIVVHDPMGLMAPYDENELRGSFGVAARMASQSDTESGQCDACCCWNILALYVSPIESGSSSGSASGSASESESGSPSGSDGGSDSGGSASATLSLSQSATGGETITASSGSGTSGTSGSGSGIGSGSGGSGSGSGSGSGAGSSKDTAIVPAEWSPTGYTALYALETPDVRFDDTLIVNLTQVDSEATIDPRYIVVCERGSIEVCGYTVDQPVLVGVRTNEDNTRINIRFAEQKPDQKLRLVLRATAIRRGFFGVRFPDKTRADFLANEYRLNIGSEFTSGGRERPHVTGPSAGRTPDAAGTEVGDE